MKPIEPSGIAPFLLLLFSTACCAEVISVRTIDVGNKTNLVSVQLTGGSTKQPGSGLVGIDVFDWNATRATSGTSASVLSPDSSSGIPADRASLLDGDVSLNTGLLNPGGRGGLSVGTSPNAKTSGLGVTFDAPILNAPGDDVVLFDFSAFSSQSADAFTITALGGGVGFNSMSLGFTTYQASQYDFTGPLLPSRSFSELNPIGTLDQLNSGVLTQSTAYPTPVYHVIGIDLSALGVADGATVTGLFIQSSTLHPVYIAGIDVAVPEPNTLILFIAAGLTLLLSKYATL